MCIVYLSKFQKITFFDSWAFMKTLASESGFAEVLYSFFQIISIKKGPSYFYGSFSVISESLQMLLKLITKEYRNSSWTMSYCPEVSSLIAK